MSLRDRVRRTRRALAPADPRSAARRRAVGDRPRGAAEAEPGGRLEAPSGGARGRPSRGPTRRKETVVRPARAAARRGGRVARALPRVLDRATRRTRTTPGGEPGMNGTLETVDNRAALRFERRLGHSVERVWRAITEPDELARWFVAPVQWTPEAGERFEAAGQTGEVTELEPPRVLAWTWGGEDFRFELAPDGGDRCGLNFTHVFEDRSLDAQHAAGWEAYLSRLDAHLDGGFMSEMEAHVPVAELHERYAERFGLDPEVGRRAIAAHTQPLTLEDGPTLRLERRYAFPIERVWRAITEPDEMRQWFPGTLDVTESEPPHLLVGTWYDDARRFELTPDGDGGVVVFTHHFDEGAKSARDAAGWDGCFERFGALLAGVPMDEADAMRTWPIKHERYAESFGVDPELGRRTYAEQTAQK